MRPLFWIAALLGMFSYGTAQVSSSYCLEEAQKAFSLVDIPTAMHQASVTEAYFQASFTMKEGGPARTSTCHLKVAQGYFFLDMDGQVSADDGEQAFSVQTRQEIIYRVPVGTLRKELAPNLSAEIFQHATVRQCAFVQVPNGSNYVKRAIMDFDAETFQKTKISNLVFWTNPLDHSLLRIEITYSGHSLYGAAQLDFQKITTLPAGNALPNAQAQFLKGDGSPNDAYSGFRVMDRR